MAYNASSNAAQAGGRYRARLQGLFGNLAGAGQAVRDFAGGLFGRQNTNNALANGGSVQEVPLTGGTLPYMGGRTDVYGSNKGAGGDIIGNEYDPSQGEFLQMLVDPAQDALGDLFSNLKGRSGAAAGAANTAAASPLKNVVGSAAGSTANSGIGRAFSNLTNAQGMPSAAQVGQAAATGSAPFLGWTRGDGLSVAGRNLGGWAMGINGAIQGAQAIGNITDLAKANQSTQDILDEIRLASMNNPYYQYDLTDEELKLLRNIKRGNADTSAGLGDVNWLGALGDTAMGALSGAAGGIPGMILGGVGGLGNSILGDMSDAQGANNAELEQLLASLEASKRNYKQMRGQRAYSQFM